MTHNLRRIDIARRLDGLDTNGRLSLAQYLMRLHGAGTSEHIQSVNSCIDALWNAGIPDSSASSYVQVFSSAKEAISKRQELAAQLKETICSDCIVKKMVDSIVKAAAQRYAHDESIDPKKEVDDLFSMCKISLSCGISYTVLVEVLDENSFDGQPDTFAIRCLNKSRALGKHTGISQEELISKLSQ